MVELNLYTFIYTRTFIWLSWIYRLLYLQHFQYLQLLVLLGLRLSEDMIALKDVNDTSMIRQHIQTINRENLLKYKNYRQLTFPAEVICTIKKLKIKKSHRGCRGRGRRRKWDVNMGIHFNVLRLLPMKTVYKDTKI